MADDWMLGKGSHAVSSHATTFGARVGGATSNTTTIAGTSTTLELEMKREGVGCCEGRVDDAASDGHICYQQ
jgi:ribulose kinase